MTNDVALTEQQTKPAKLEKYDKNPYIDNTLATLKTVKKKKKTASGVTQTIYTDKDGAQFNAGTIYTTEYVDDAQFVKIFANGLSSFFNLNANAIRTLIIVLAIYQDNFDRDFIFCTHEMALKVCEKYNVTPPKSKNTFSKGLRDLAEAGFLAKSSLGSAMWWINPSVIFNGNRLVLAHQYVKKPKTEGKEENLIDVSEQNAIEQQQTGESTNGN